MMLFRPGNADHADASEELEGLERFLRHPSPDNPHAGRGASGCRLSMVTALILIRPARMRCATREA